MLLQACSVSTPEVTATIVPSPTNTPTLELSPTATPEPTLKPSPTIIIPTLTPTAIILTETIAHPTTVPSVSDSETKGIVIDHNTVSLFDEIPDEYLQAASEILLFHRHASVGANIRMGLDCLANEFPERPYAPDISQLGDKRPPWCDQGLDAEEIIFDAKYNSSNWNFELHSQPNANPGWYNKVNYFIERMNHLAPEESYDYASFNFGYVEDQSINNYFFSADDSNSRFPNVADLEALDDQFPDTELIWWTMALARRSEPQHETFNQNLRKYAKEHGKILFDIADIESHLPDGTPCTGIDQNEKPNDIEALCEAYTTEPVGGHLNAKGSLRMAKAMWVLMATLAGWDGQIE